MKPTDVQKLFEEALEARQNSYCPYSGFAVGAALLAQNGDIFYGCNIENSSYGATICAERSAFSGAISQGVRAFSAIAIAGGYTKEETLVPAYPCGICRQVMSEFCAPKTFQIILGTSPEELQIHTLEEILPYGFSLSPVP